METLEINFKKPKDKNTVYQTAYFNSKTLAITSDSDMYIRGKKNRFNVTKRCVSLRVYG